MIDINKTKQAMLNKKQISFRIDKKLFNEFDKFCKQNKIIKSKLIEEMIKNILKEKKWQ